MLKSLLLIAALVYFGFGLLLFVGQRGFIYFPVNALPSNLEKRVFENDGEAIKTSIINQGSEQAIIYFGGNAENVDYNAFEFQQLLNGYTVYLVKYRGYAGSTGEPTEQGIYADALHIYDEIKTDYQSVSVIGRSLGSGVATYLASQRKVKRLVLVTPFDSVKNVAQAVFPMYPMGILLKDKHDSLSRAKDITSDTLILAAENDEVIKMKHTLSLLNGFEQDVHFKEIKGANHNDISENSVYVDTLSAFFKK